MNETALAFRKARAVGQAALADALYSRIQAVSKWETGVSHRQGNRG